LRRRFAAAMADIGAPWPAAVAVSGGGDSLALMLLLAGWAERSGLPPPAVVVVDHALREGSDSEARRAADWAENVGLSAAVLVRKGRPPVGDIEAFARRARYRLIGGWAKKVGVKAIFLAHTIDDQAETFLLRLMRGSGVDGLSAMRPLSPFPLGGFAGVALARPLLSFAREELRVFLCAEKQTWIDDPMNKDTRFTRVRVRDAWPVLEELGLSRRRIADAAAHLARARVALEEAAEDLRQRACRKKEGGLLLDASALRATPAEVALRVLAGSLMAVSHKEYRPRFERLSRLYRKLVQGEVRSGCTLHGCQIAPAPRRLAHFGTDTLHIRPEPARRDKKKPKIKE
jgi:tRNA(Ile)-lysidine synthase